MFFVSVYISMACIPSSRPMPDILYPPNGASVWTELLEFTLRTPAWSALRRPQGLADVPAPDRAGQAVRGGVGEPDRLLLGVERDDRHDRSEDLLAGDPHLVGDPGEDRRQDVRPGGQGRIVRARRRRPAARRPPAGRSRCSRGPARAGAGGPSSRPRSPRPTGRRPSPPGRRGEQLDDLVVDGALDEDPAPGAAVLAAVVEDGVRATRARTARDRRRRRRCSGSCRRAPG